MDDLKDIIKTRLSDALQGETQEVAARKLSTTQGNISKLVNGQQLPTIDMLHEISKVYKVSSDWLLGLSDQKEIDGVALDKLTYEQAALVIDRLLELGTLSISEEGETIDSDNVKVNDRALSYMLRRRLKLYEVGEDFVEMWKSKSVPLYRGLRLLSYKGRMEEAIDTRTWTAFNKDGDWVALIKDLGSMSEEELTELIEKSKKAKDGNKNG